MKASQFQTGSTSILLTKRRKVYIYVLVDPRSDEVRYLGKTVDYKRRIYAHVKDQRAKTHKGYWIKSLIKTGVVPKLVVIEQTDEDHWQDRERHWIADLKKNGADLTNHRDGGAGSSLSSIARQKISAIMTPEMRKQISSKLRGRTKITIEGRARLSKSRRESSQAHKVSREDWKTLSCRDICEKYGLSYGAVWTFKRTRNMKTKRYNICGTTGGTLISPSNAVITFRSISELCRKYQDLSHSGISRLLSGCFKSYLGWRA